MNAAQPSLGRRRFLTRLFQPEDTALTHLVPLPALRAGGNGVFWSLAGNADTGVVYLGGDDGLLYRHEDGQWQRESVDSEHNIHALCVQQKHVFAVGWLGQICIREAGAWRAVQGGGSDAARVNWPLFDIEACGEEGPWAVGDQGRVTHLVDGQWQEEACPTTANLRCVLPLADGRVLAAGLGGELLEKTEGGWQKIETNTGCAIVSIAQLDDNSFVAVGGEYSVNEGEFVGRIFLLQDGQFSAVDTAQRLPRLRRVRRSGDTLLIMGDGGAVWRWSATGVKRIPGRARYDLHDALSVADDVFFCGDGETLLSEQPAGLGSAPLVSNVPRWEQLAAGETQRCLRALLSPEPGQLIAAGDGGEVLHLHDGHIDKKQIPGDLTVHALWCSSPRNVLAACDAATIAHYDGDAWSIVHRGEQDVPLLAITGFGPHDVFAVGDAGLALRYDGLMWRQLESGTRQELYGLWGQDSSHLLAVGGGGLVLRFDGKAWKSFTAGTHQDLYAVHGRGLNSLHLAGLGGTLIRFEDNAWHREFTGVRSDLHAIAGDGPIFVSGSNGTILRGEGGDWHPEESGVTATLQTLLCTGTQCYAAGNSGVLLRRVRK